MKFQVHIFIPSQKPMKNFRNPLQCKWKLSYPLPSSPVNSVFIVVLSIFRNSAISGINFPISCSGKHILNRFSSVSDSR